MNEHITVKRASRLAIAATTLAVAAVLAVGAAPAQAQAKPCRESSPYISIQDGFAWNFVGEYAGDAIFKVVLSKAACGYVNVHWATKAMAPGPGSATPGADYHTSSGDIAFGAGSTVAWVHVPLVSDTAVESVESFLVNLTNPSGATISDAQGVMDIISFQP